MKISKLILTIVILTTHCILAKASAIAVSIASSSNASCYGMANGSATTSVSGNIGTITYSWSPGNMTTANVSGLTAGTYTVTVTDGADATQSQTTVTISQPPPLNSSTQSTNVSCFGGSNGTINVDVTGGTPPFAFSWSGSSSTDSTRTGLLAGTHTYTITEANGCVYTPLTITITQPTVLSGTPSITNVTCNGLSNGSVMAFAAGGTPPYTYSWISSGSTAQTFSLLPAGTYSCDITDNKGCFTTISASINQPSVLTADAGSAVFICAQQAAGITASGFGGTSAYTYMWSPSSGLSNPNIADPIMTAATSMIYTTTVTDVNGCTDQDTVNVVVLTPPTANAGADLSLCIGASATIGMTSLGGHTYSWSPATDLSSAMVSNPVCTPSSSQTLTLFVTEDATGCVSSDVAIITVNALPIIETSVDYSICSGGNTTFSVSGATSYSWSPSTFLDNTLIDNPICTPFSTTTYTVYGTDANNCTSYDLLTLTVNPLPSVNAGIDQTICEGSAASLSASGTNTYIWTADTSMTATVTYMPVITTSYTVYGTDINGCENFDEVLVSVNPKPIVNYSNVDPTTCGGTGSLNFTLTNGSFSGNFLINGNGASSPLITPAGSYTVITQDASTMCIDTDIVVLNPFISTLYISMTSTTTACNMPNGAIYADINGGTLPYTKLATFNTAPILFNSDTLNNVMAGTYEVTVTDAANCVVSDITTMGDTGFLPTISGTVMLNASTVTGGIIYVYKTIGQILAPTDSTIIEPNGSYSITIGDLGQYRMKAVLDPGVYPFALPTYAGNVHRSDSSSLLMINCSQNQTINFDVINIVPPTQAGASVSGFIWDDTDTSGGQRIGIRKPGEPIKGVGIIIQRRPGGSASMRTTTDGDGFYNFDSIPNGDYDIYVEMATGNLLHTYDLSVQAASDVFESQNFYVDSISGTIDTVNVNPDSVFATRVIRIESVNEVTFKLYPNPVLSNAKIDFISPTNDQLLIGVEDYSGRIILNDKIVELKKGSNLILMDELNEYPAGFYFIRLKGKSLDSRIKVIKN